MSAGSSASAATTPPIPPTLAQGTEFVGEYLDSAFVESPYLLRRADGTMVVVSKLLYLVATCIDGAADVPRISELASIQLGRPLSPENVTYLIDQKLEPLGIVDDRSRAATAPSAPALGIGLRGALLPQRAVKRVSATLSCLFWPPLVIVFVVGMVAFDVWLFFIRGVGVDSGRLVLEPSTMIVAYGALFMSAAFHELGHAAAGHRGGARPGPIGVGLYLIWPAFYSDMTDSYRLSRAGRLRTDLGGVYFNAVFIVVCAAVYRLTGSSDILIAIVLQNLLIASQFLPFLRLDGYYVVSDLIGVPDLFSSIRPVLARLVPGRKAMETGGQERLRPAARALVTVWVMVTVPLLVGMLVFTALHLPDIVEGLASRASVEAHRLSQAAGRGDITLGALSLLQFATIAVVPLGASLTLGAGIRRISAFTALRRRLARVEGSCNQVGTTGGPTSQGSRQAGSRARTHRH